MNEKKGQKTTKSITNLKNLEWEQKRTKSETQKKKKKEKLVLYGKRCRAIVLLMKSLGNGSCLHATISLGKLAPVVMGHQWMAM